MDENQLSNIVIGCALDVHTALGPGLLENAYQECLFYKINQKGLFVEKEKYMPVIFEGVKIDCGYRLDILVEGKLIVELKSVKNLDSIHIAQVMTYLKLSKLKLGLLMNFNEIRLKNGIKRVVLDL
jgi:GxxExxY protein